MKKKKHILLNSKTLETENIFFKIRVPSSLLMSESASLFCQFPPIVPRLSQSEIIALSKGDIRRFDTYDAKCIGIVPDTKTKGHILIFQHLEVDSRVIDNAFPALTFWWKTIDKLYKSHHQSLQKHLAWHIWSDHGTFYHTFPCPIALEERVFRYNGLQLDIYCVESGMIGDLDYARLKCAHDYVISYGGEFFHDMSVHVFDLLDLSRTDLELETITQQHNRPEALQKYEAYESKSAILEFSLGIAADAHIPYYPEDFESLFNLDFRWHRVVEKRFGPTGFCALLDAIREFCEFCEFY